MTTMQQIPAQAMTRAVLGRIVNAIAAEDWTALREVIAPHVLYWRPGTNDRLDGIEAYIEQWMSLARHPARLRYTPHSVVVEGDLGVVEATARALMPDGEVVVFSTVSIMRVEDGRLVEEREYIVDRSPSR